MKKNDPINERKVRFTITIEPVVFLLVTAGVIQVAN